MLILKGNVGKSKIVEKILDDYSEDESLVISIGEYTIPQSHYTIEDIPTFNELKDFLLDNISEECKFIIVYTNLKEELTSEINILLSELESKYENIRCLLTCR